MTFLSPFLTHTHHTYIPHTPHTPHTTHHTDEGGVRRDELVNWYLKEVEADIETLSELAEKKVLVEKVIDRLVQHVSVQCAVIERLIINTCGRSSQTPCMQYTLPRSVSCSIPQFT